MNSQNENNTYIIPPNFIGVGTFLGGMFKARNAVEAGILAVLFGIPIFSFGDLSLTARIIIFCITGLPVSLIALVGISGESLSSFILTFLKFVKNRRVISASQNESKQSRTVKAAQTAVLPYLNPAAQYLPIEKVSSGIIYTKDKRYVKILEVVPINFLLRNEREQRNIIYSFMSYLKISPVKLQFKVLTRRADINNHIKTVEDELMHETNEQCRLMQKDYLQFVQQISAREAVTRRFFLIFEYEPWSNTRKSEEDEAITTLQAAVQTAINYLRQCGNKVVVPENEDEFVIDILYNLMFRNESAIKPLTQKVTETAAFHMANNPNYDLDSIPAAEFFAPREIDFTHGRYICIDGLYYAYLFVPSDGYKRQVPAGWLSLIVNAGDGIDLDMFLTR